MEEEKKTDRCCSECKTTKTPMWRGGPSCPKVSSSTLNPYIHLVLFELKRKLYNYSEVFFFLLFAVEFTVTLQCMWDQIQETKTVRVIGYSYYSQPQRLQEDKSITIIFTWWRVFEETTDSKGGRTSSSLSIIIVS